jgi:hypothetical protein
MKRNLFFSFLATFVFLSCQSRTPKPPVPNRQVHTYTGIESSASSIESKQLAAEEETNFITEVNFYKQSSTVTKDAENEIKKMIKDAVQEGNIDKIKLVTWADSEYPSVHNDSLPKKERILAERRNESLEKMIHTIDGTIHVEKISMAERPSWTKKVLGSDEVKLKESLETGGIPNTDTSIKIPGAASKSIVIVKLED